MTTYIRTKLNVKTVQGNKVTLKFSVFDENGDPYPLSALEILWSCRNSLTKETVLEKQTGDGITIMSVPDDHKFNVVLESADTLPLLDLHDHEATIMDVDDAVSVKNDDNSFGTIFFREKV